MPILVRCTCGKKLSAPDTMAGKRVACPACKTIVEIPAGEAATQTSAPAPSPPNTFIVSCVCGQQFTATPAMAGMQSNCPTCGSLITVPGAAAPSPQFAAPQYAPQQYAPQPPANDEYRLQGDYPQQAYGTQSPYGAAPGTGAWNPQGNAAPPSDPFATGVFSSAYDQRTITLPPMPGQASYSQPSSHTLGAASTTLPNAYAPPSTSYTPPQTSSDGWGQVGGGIGLMVLSVVWFCGGLFFDIIFFYPPILFIIGLIMFIKGIIGKLSG